MPLLQNYWQKEKHIWLTIIGFFIATRFVLFLIGSMSITYLEPVKNMPPWRQTIANVHPHLALWTLWDSEWYLDIAKHGYELPQPFSWTTHQDIGFFPLYPFVVNGFEKIVRDYVVSGLFVSNMAFVVACYFFYKLVSLEFDEQSGERSVWYLFLFPTAYIFSALYPESLLLLLSVTTLYAARKEKWWLAGLLGFFAALTKPVGVFVALPALLMYLKNKKYNWRNIRWSVLFVGVIGLGILSFALFTYAITGDFFAYSHIQQAAWGHHFGNPIKTLISSFQPFNPDLPIQSSGLIIALIILIAGIKKIPFAYWMYAVALVLFDPFTGQVDSALRYLAIAFPLVMILSQWGKHTTADRIIMLSMALLQGFFFALWVANFWFVS